MCICVSNTYKLFEELFTYSLSPGHRVHFAKSRPYLDPILLEYSENVQTDNDSTRIPITLD